MFPDLNGRISDPNCTIQLKTNQQNCSLIQNSQGLGQINLVKQTKPVYSALKKYLFLLCQILCKTVYVYPQIWLVHHSGDLNNKQMYAIPSIFDILSVGFLLIE